MYIVFLLYFTSLSLPFGVYGVYPWLKRGQRINARGKKKPPAPGFELGFPGSWSTSNGNALP